MASRISLQKNLEKILGTRNVYYNPPEDLVLDYPCIIYHLDDIERRSADNIGYMIKKRYQLLLISRLPDHPAIDVLIQEKWCSFDRSYRADNLEHYVMTIYW